MSVNLSVLTMRINLPCGEVTASPIASHDAASEPTVVLPPLDTLSLADVPDVDLGVLREAEQLTRAVSPS